MAAAVPAPSGAARLVEDDAAEARLAERLPVNGADVFHGYVWDGELPVPPLGEDGMIRSQERDTRGIERRRHRSGMAPRARCGNGGERRLMAAASPLTFSRRTKRETPATFRLCCSLRTAPIDSMTTTLVDLTATCVHRGRRVARGLDMIEPQCSLATWCKLEAHPRLTRRHT